MDNIDPRIVRIGIEVRGRLRTYTDLAITVTGMKFTNPNQGECYVTIANLEESVANFILTETTPFNRNRTPKNLIVEVGRRSTGLSLLYVGNIFRTSITQPPDKILTIRALSGQYQKGNVVGVSSPAISSLSQIAAQVAESLGAVLVFQATDTQVANYAFTGPALKQLSKLEEMGDIDVYLDNDQLIVKDKNKALNGKVRRVSESAGMVGIPTITEQGVSVTMLYDNRVVLGGQLDVESRQFPAVNGSYIIYRLNYNIANRDVPFYLTAECRRANRGG